MQHHEARRLLAEFARERGCWVASAASQVRADAVWLTGSLSRGDEDEWSDADLIIVGGDHLPTGAMITVEVPWNGPAGGRYTGAMYPAGQLPLWTDWYLWPDDLPVPRDARLLRGRGSVGALTLQESLDLYGRGAGGPTGNPDDHVLAMIPLTAKHIARGNARAAESMATMLGLASGADPLTGLRTLLARTPGPENARDRIRILLDVVEATAISNPSQGA